MPPKFLREKSTCASAVPGETVTALPSPCCCVPPSPAARWPPLTRLPCHRRAFAAVDDYQGEKHLNRCTGFCRAGQARRGSESHVCLAQRGASAVRTSDDLAGACNCDSLLTCRRACRHADTARVRVHEKDRRRARGTQSERERARRAYFREALRLRDKGRPTSSARRKRSPFCTRLLS